MVKHTLTIRQLLGTNCLRMFDHFVKRVKINIGKNASFCIIPIILKTEI